MKTAERWMDDLAFLMERGMKERANWINMIRAIQADAYDEGVKVMYEKVTAKLGVSSEN